VNGFVKTATLFQTSKDNAVVVEVACEKNKKCGVDQRTFKGIWARSFARAALAAPFTADTINNILSTSAKAAASGCTRGNGNGAECSFSWVDTSEQKPGLGEVFNALEVVQSLLYPSAKGFKTATGGGDGTSGSNATQSGGASRSSGASSPQKTGAAGTLVASITAVLTVAFATMLSM
jgi:mannan endo-1,6-alpha-mannosidase